MSEKKFYFDINLQDNEVNNLKADTLDINSNLASANTKRIVYWAGDYYYSDGTGWTLMANVVPTGGTSGQVLSKIDGTNYNTQWITPTSGGPADQLIFQAKYNQAGGILKGQAVYVSGANGTNILVSKADYSSEATSSKTLGLAIEDGANNHMGAVISDGLLSGLNTSAANAAGDPVWLGDDGNLIYGLANKPYAPNHLVFIGIVTRKNSSNGEIFVKVQNGFELQELHDVDLISTVPVNGDVLGYNGTLWVNKSIALWLGFTPENVANKENTTLDTSTTKYPTNNLVKTNIDTKAALSSPAFTGVPTAPTAAAGTNTTQLATTAFVTNAVSKQPEAIQAACSDETTALSVGTGRLTFRAPFAITLTSVRISCTTAPTGAAIIVNVRKNGVTIFSTKPQIAAGATTSVGGAVPGVLSTTAIADDDILAVDIDQIGSTVAGTGLKITFLGTRT